VGSTSFPFPLKGGREKTGWLADPGVGGVGGRRKNLKPETTLFPKIHKRTVNGLEGGTLKVGRGHWGKVRKQCHEVG